MAVHGRSAADGDRRQRARARISGPDRQDHQGLQGLVAEQSAEIEDLRAACAKRVGAARPAALPAESTPPQPVSAAESERRRLAVNADRSAYQQQGLRPASRVDLDGNPAGMVSRREARYARLTRDLVEDAARWFLLDDSAAPE